MTTTTNRITKTPDICGGRACILGHRIPVWGLVRYRQLDMTDAEILEAYPSLNAADLDAAWEYFAANRNEIDHDIRENEDEDAPAE